MNILYRKRNYEPKLRVFFLLLFIIFAFVASYLGYNAGLDIVHKDVGFITFLTACFSVYFLRATIHTFFAIFRRQLVLFPTTSEYELFYRCRK